jgi:hypothetical protein
MIVATRVGLRLVEVHDCLQRDDAVLCDLLPAVQARFAIHRFLVTLVAGRSSRDTQPRSAFGFHLGRRLPSNPLEI